jgi:deoxyadenosine/deoxycytidine kinase
VIGVGKTSLAGSGPAVPARLILEEPGGESTLEDFYKDRRYRSRPDVLPRQSRYQELKEKTQPDLFHEDRERLPVPERRIFANLNLSDRELHLYDQVAPLLSRTRGAGSVYLRQGPRCDGAHPAARPPYERLMEPKYIGTLSRRIIIFFHFREAPSSS